MVKATEKQNLIPKVNVSITHQLQKMRNVKKPNQIKTMTDDSKYYEKKYQCLNHLDNSESWVYIQYQGVVIRDTNDQ